MLNLFIRGGIFMWPLLFIGMGIIIVSVVKAGELFGSKSLGRSRLESGLNGIILWGGLSAVLGFLAHFWGLYMAMLAIREANDISPAIVADGFAVSLITILFGLLIFLLSALAWMLLRWRLKKLS